MNEEEEEEENENNVVCNVAKIMKNWQIKYHLNKISFYFKHFCINEKNVSSYFYLFPVLFIFLFYFPLFGR